MAPTPKAQASAINALMTLNTKAIEAIEKGLGGSLTPAAAQAVRDWLAQAFDLGRAHAGTKAPRKA
jgi:hypothetical protein